MRKKSDVFMIIIIFWLSSFGFLRTSYNDTETYAKLFAEAQSLSEGWINGSFTKWSENPLYELYISFIRSLTDNYHIFFLFPAAMYNLVFVKLCKQYSVSPSVSLLIYFSIGTYIMYVAALKQSFAFGFLLFAVPYLIEKKYGRFYLFVALASLFHVFAVLFAVLPFVIEKPWGKRTWILCAVMVGAMLTYDETLGSILEYADTVDVNMKSEEVFFDQQLSVLRVLVYFAPGFISLVFRKRLFTNAGRKEYTFVMISIFSALILMLGMVKGANLFSRMAGFFDFSSAIILPWMIYKLFNKRSAQFVTIVAVFLYFGYFMYEFAVTKDFGNNYKAITMTEFIISLFR